MSATAFHFPSGGKYTKQTAFWEASHFFSRDFLLWFWIGKKLHIRPEYLCLTALACALAASVSILHEHWRVTLFLVHLNNAIDCADGTLARYTHQASRFGRFVDVACDGLGVTALCVSLAIQLSTTHTALQATSVGVAFWLVLFLECSMANYANLRYAAATNNTVINSKIDERLLSTDTQPPRAQKILMRFYAIVFGWQDRLCDTGHTALTRTLTVAEKQKMDTAKWIVSAHSFFFFGIVIQCILVVAALTSLETALATYFCISLSSFALLMVLKILYAKSAFTS